MKSMTPSTQRLQAHMHIDTLPYWFFIMLFSREVHTWLGNAEEEKTAQKEQLYGPQVGAAKCLGNLFHLSSMHYADGCQ